MMLDSLEAQKGTNQMNRQDAKKAKKRERNMREKK